MPALDDLGAKTFPKSLSRATLVAVLTVNGLRGRWQDNARAIENS